MTERDTAKLAPNQKPINVVTITNKLKLVTRPTKGRIIIHPTSVHIKVLLCPYLSAIIPAKVPPMAEVINMPRRINVFTVSETCQTCSKNIGKLFAAVNIASLNKKYAIRKRPTLGTSSKRFVSLKVFFISDLIDNFTGTFFGSLKKISIGSDSKKKRITEGRSVSARGFAPN